MKRLRYFFDPGSGVCLWAANESANAAYGYAVDHNDLPLSAKTTTLLSRLTAKFDQSLDWNNPAERGPEWTTAAEQEFMGDADLGLQALRDELGTAEFEVAAEHRQDRSSSGRP